MTAATARDGNRLIALARKVAAVVWAAQALERELVGTSLAGELEDPDERRAFEACGWLRDLAEDLSQELADQVDGFATRADHFRAASGGTASEGIARCEVTPDELESIENLALLIRDGRALVDAAKSSALVSAVESKIAELEDQLLRLEDLRVRGRATREVVRAAAGAEDLS